MTIEYAVPGPPTGPPGVSGHPRPGDWSGQDPNPMRAPLEPARPPSVPMPSTERPSPRDAVSHEKTPTPNDGARKAAGALTGKLSSCLAALEAAISRCERNRTTVARDEKEISGEGAREHYAQADAKLNQERSRLLGMRERVYQLAASMSDAVDQIMSELGAGAKAGQDRASSGKPVGRPKRAKPVKRTKSAKPAEQAKAAKPAGRPKSAKSAERSKSAKPAAHAPQGESPRKDAELDGLSEIDLQRHAVAAFGLNPEDVKKAAKKQSDQS